jgi:hypothetical protein
MKLLLSTICILLLALFAYQVMSYPMELDGSTNQSLNKELAKSIDYELPQLSVLNSIDKYSEIVQRPLFVKDRAAAVTAQVVNKVKTVDELSHLILVGTARSTDVQIAIIADTKAKQMERLKAGESYKDWNIAEVSTDHITFQNDELEYKLFITPIEGSTKAKQAKLIGQLNKSKIKEAAEAIKSYKDSKRSYKNKASNFDSNSKTTDQKIAGKIWNYDKKPEANKTIDSSTAKEKPARKSPIKIPTEEEKDAAYYEGVDDSAESSSSASDRETTAREISAEDYYDDEDISEDELKALEGLGAKIFDD